MTDESKLRIETNLERDSNNSITVITNTKKKHLKGTNFAFMFLGMFDDLASDKELNLTDIRVLCGLIANLDFGNQISISQAKLAKDIGIAQPHIANSISKLIEKDYIAIIAKKGRQNIYQLNLECGLKGRPEDLHSLKRFWNERKKHDAG